MNYIAHLSSFLILCGAMLMLVNIVLYRQTIKRANHTSPEPSSVTKSLSRLHLLLMCFFLASYLAVLYFFVSEVEFASSLFVSVIFFFGAVFVFLGIIVQRRMISTLHSFNKSLEESNNRLQKEQQALLLVNARLESEVETRIQAEESNQLKSNLLSLVSHELRTPLTSIYGFTKLLQKGVSSLSPDEECASYNNKKERIENNISIICSECSRLTRLINNFLDLARIESGKTDWHDSRHSLSELIDGAISVVEGILLDKPSVSLKKNVPDNLPELFVDGAVPDN